MEGFDKIRNLNLAELGEKDTTSEESTVVAAENAEIVEESADMTKEPEKKQEMEIQGQYYKVDSKITTPIMREFLFGHYYRQPLIILMTIVGIGLLAYAIIMRPSAMTSYLIASLFLVIGYPLSFVSKANSIVKNNKAFQHTFHYTFDEWGIHLKIGDDLLDVAWKYVVRIRKLKNIAVIYTGKNNGYLLPYADLGNQKEEILNFIETMKQNNGR